MGRALDLVRLIQLRVAMVALVGMMLITVADVFMRYVMHRPIEGAYNIVESCLAVFVFFGIAATFIERRNIVIDLIDTIAPRRILAALVRISDAISVACLIVIGWAMIDPMLQVYDYGDTKPELGLPLVVLWVAALVGLAGTLVSALGAMLLPPAPGHVTHYGPVGE